ncbi:MAG: hypothetical protein U9N11_07560 [Campylobacterota bacterium]|nr:hypothetical protein [Campylobacterota bacterium]
MKKIIIGTVAVIGLAFVVNGCSKGNMGDRMFSKFDSDSDGFVDKTEYFAISSARFERADDNNDEKVTQKEINDTFIAKKFPKKVATWLKESDLDGDNTVNYMEMRKKSKGEFDAQDTNKDGKLSLVEMKEYRAKMH